MATKHNHLQYLKEKGRFKVDCGLVIFSREEIEILEKYGHWFQALTNGELQPITELQENFIRVAKGEKKPFSEFEQAWFRYLGRKRIEAQYGDSLNARYEPESDSFYNREMAKQQKRIMFNVIRKTHKE